MSNAQTAVEEVWEALAAHFRRSADPVEVPEHLVEITALNEEAVINAVRVLENKHGDAEPYLFCHDVPVV